MNIKKGDRIELIKMENDPNPILPGEKGTVVEARLDGPKETQQIEVSWDSGRTLFLIPEDSFKIIKE